MIIDAVQDAHSSKFGVIRSAFARRAARCLVACGLVLPSIARAQDTHYVLVDRQACLERIPAAAFRRVAVYAYAEFPDSVSRSFASSVDNLVQAVVFKAHQLLGAPAGTAPAGEPAVAWWGVGDPLQLMAYRDGRITRRANPGVRSTAAWLLARALDSTETGGILDWSDLRGRDSVAFDIGLDRPSVDSLGTLSVPRIRRPAVPLLSVSAPWERQVAPQPGRQVHPHYPEAARNEGYQATLIMQFLVDTMGRVVDSTIRDVWPKDKPRLTGHELSQYTSFLRATTSALRRMEFEPASIGGCRVKQLAEMPFVFGLNP